MTFDGVSVLCLDAGGVLLFPDWARVSEVLARHGLHADAAQLAEADLRARPAFDRREVVGATGNAGHARSYYEYVLDAAGLPDGELRKAALGTLRASHRARSLWDVPAPDAPAALARIRATGRRLVVVSNSDGRLGRLLAGAGLAPFFDAAIDSQDVGVEKPDPRIFAIALDRVGGRAAEAAHVGDIYHVDVVGARAAGLVPVLIDPLDLQPAADCERVHSLAELAARMDGAAVQG